MKNIIREHYKQFYVNELDNQGEMDKFLETQNLQPVRRLSYHTSPNKEKLWA